MICRQQGFGNNFLLKWQMGFGIVFLSPPCNTFSRARHLWKKSPGPRPIRSKQYPYGFPWVSNVSKQTLGQHNFFIFQCKRMAITAFRAGIFFLWEHPEDLGRVKDTDDEPGSIWQWDELRRLQQETGAITWAVYQCHFGVTLLKKDESIIPQKKCEVSQIRSSTLNCLVVKESFLQTATETLLLHSSLTTNNS